MITRISRIARKILIDLVAMKTISIMTIITIFLLENDIITTIIDC
jgi:hypothetical protein